MNTKLFKKLKSVVIETAGNELLFEISQENTPKYLEESLERFRVTFNAITGATSLQDELTSDQNYELTSLYESIRSAVKDVIYALNDVETAKNKLKDIEKDHEV